MQRGDDSVMRSRLITVYRQLAEALENRDWDSLARIDQDLRTCLQELAQRDVLSEEVVQIKRQLQQLHRRAISACGEACTEFRQVLQAHLEYQEGRSAYLRIDMLQGEG
jgi:DNA-binding GntR family transcriptional regulator